MSSCPCCSSQLLRHIQYQEIYWFCSSCRQRMPNFQTFGYRERRSPALGVTNSYTAKAYNSCVIGIDVADFRQLEQ